MKDIYLPLKKEVTNSNVMIDSADIRNMIIRSLEHCAL